MTYMKPLTFFYMRKDQRRYCREDPLGVDQRNNGDDMWRIKQIFDGDYGCEELQPGQKPKVSVTLVDDAGNEKFVSVEDDWLTENRLDIGSEWPKEEM